MNNLKSNKIIFSKSAKAETKSANQDQKVYIIGKVWLTLVKKMEYAIAKVSTKGQIVIPSFLRKDVNAGDEFLMIKENGKIILKNMKDLATNLKEDLIFAERVEKAWQDYDKGKFKKKNKQDFLKELRAC